MGQQFLSLEQQSSSLEQQLTPLEKQFSPFEQFWSFDEQHLGLMQEQGLEQESFCQMVLQLISDAGQKNIQT